MAIANQWFKIVLFHDAIRDCPYHNLCILVVHHGRVEVEVGDIQAVLVGGGAHGGEDAVDDKLCRGQVSGMGADIFRVFNEIISNGEVDTVGLIFLWLNAKTSGT
jgi:hypothetical protein